jgi:hypothetical protein
MTASPGHHVRGGTICTVSAATAAQCRLHRVLTGYCDKRRQIGGDRPVIVAYKINAARNAPAGAE